MGERERTIYKDVYNPTETELIHLYGSIQEDNRLLKERANLSKSLRERNEYLKEYAILNSTKPLKSVQDFIDKYSNEYHTVIYNNIAHTIRIKGSMRVDVFHLLNTEAEQFKFNNITLES